MPHGGRIIINRKLDICRYEEEQQAAIFLENKSFRYFTNYATCPWLSLFGPCLSLVCSCLSRVRPCLFRVSSMMSLIHLVSYIYLIAGQSNGYYPWIGLFHKVRLAPTMVLTSPLRVLLHIVWVGQYCFYTSGFILLGFFALCTSPKGLIIQI